ncbi:MAG: GtrA family protein [Anaerolineales bacterium]|nr:GtrA family protein [Anaerolineales bacterium]
MILIRDAKERERFVKFAVVGTIGFGVDSLTFNLVRSGLKFPAEISSVISFCAAVVSNFLFNRYWTYPDSRSKPVVNQIGQFAIVNTAGLLIRTVVFSLIHKPMVKLFEIILPDFLLSPTVLGENMSLAIVVIIVMFWNFFINRFWTYNDVK